MREPAPDYASRQYERPNQPWTCGLGGDGHACPAGPTARGKCPALAECVPTRNGDRWTCNRSPLRGGECGDGPTPDGACGCVHHCRPVRSLRAMRGRFVSACTLLAAGGLLMLLSADWRDQAISPGPLADQHAQLLTGGAREPNCAACHAAAKEGVTGWATSLAGFHDEPKQSQLCMACHAKTIESRLAVNAHNVAPELLQNITDHQRSELGSEPPGLSPRDEPAGSLEVACAACHREHRGTQHDLTAMSDAACQSCHQQQFTSFATNHPDFGNWPYKRRTRIVFDHASHAAKHFAEKKQSFDCKTCHVEDQSGAVQLLASYETTCASCHNEKISTSVAKGVPVFELPTLDVEALKTAGHDIGEWPQSATGDFDGRLPPAMKLLLSADPSAATAIKTLGADFEFFDVEPDDAEQLAACATLVTAIKKLLADVGTSGTAAVRERLNLALERQVADAEVESLLTGLPKAELSDALKQWFPISSSDMLSKGDMLTGGGMLSTRSGVSVSDARRNMPTPPDGESMPSTLVRMLPKISDMPPLRFDAPGKWTRDDATLSIRYQPAGHEDPVLTGWLELLAKTPNLPHQPVALAKFKELAKPTAPGLCASCHSSERAADGALAVNWRAYDRSTALRTLTKFSHGPHLLLPQLADCTSCHAINKTANTSASYAGENPHEFISDFSPMSKQHCATCHTAKAAGESCQKCHDYHVDTVETWRSEHFFLNTNQR